MLAAAHQPISWCCCSYRHTCGFWPATAMWTFGHKRCSWTVSAPCARRSGMSGLLFERSFCHTLDSCMVSLLCGPSCVSSDLLFEWSFCHNTSSWTVSPQCGFSCDSPERCAPQSWSHRTSSWKVFLQSDISCVGSNLASERIFSHIWSSCKVSLPCETSCVFADCPYDQTSSHTRSRRRTFSRAHIWLHSQRRPQSSNLTELLCCPHTRHHWPQSQVQESLTTSHKPDLQVGLDHSSWLILVLHSSLHWLLSPSVQFVFVEAVRTRVSLHLPPSPHSALEAALPPDWSRVPPVPL